MSGTSTPRWREPVADLRHGGGGLVAIDGDAHHLRAGAGERGDLAGGRLDVGGVGVGHRLHAIGAPPPTVTAPSPSPTRTPTVLWRGRGPKASGPSKNM